MSLWGNLDNLVSAPKFLIDGANTSIVPAANTDRDYGGLSRNTNLSNAFLVDSTEAAVAGNRANGIKTPGWNLYKTYGSGRKFVEILVPMRVNANTAGDLGVFSNTTIEDSSIADS